MSVRCLMNGLEVNYPCSPVCALFGDCVTAFEKQKKANVSTNADRIRAMSDEELANVLTDFSNNGGWVTETGREICYERNIEWLKQPAE